LSLDGFTLANFVSGVFVGVTVCVIIINSISEFVIGMYGFFMVWSRVGWGIGSRGMVDGGVVDRDREMVGGSMVWGSMEGGMVGGSMEGGVVHWGCMVYSGCVMERGGMVYKWGSVVHWGSMEGCVVYWGTEDTVVYWGGVEGVGGNSDIAFGTERFLGVLVG